VITVVIPAHNEGRVIGRLLGQLAAGTETGELDVIVVANGCTDDTAAVAAAFGPPVRVLSIPVASKREAMLAGDRAAGGFPRVYADADIELGAADVRALADALRQPGVLAAAPSRVVRLAGRPWPVRWYYDVWMRLPEVRHGLFGRGVVAVAGAGHERVSRLPALVADDLAISLAFAAGERRVVAAAQAVVHPPRTFADLLRRRVRAVQGVAQLEGAAAAPASAARTRVPDLAALIRGRPALAPRVALFLAVAAAARLAARRAVASGDYSGWLRDESSRRG
jgi:glycosyltransferase involved in cell wall biosynthesis